MNQSTQQNQRFYHLSFKLLLAIVIWALCILSFVGSTVMVTFRMENHAIAINQAGSLRAKIYRISALATAKHHQTEIRQQSKQFNQILDNIEKLDTSLFLQHQHKTDFRKNIALIRNDFTLFQAAVNQVQNQQITQSTLLQKTRLLNRQLEQFVQAIENENTQTINLLRNVRFALILIVLLSAISSFYLLKRFVLLPVKIINHGINQIAAGQWHTRTKVASNDEFRLLSNGFNSMAEHLEKTYMHLENQVTKKTSELNHAEYHRQILHEMTAFLHQKSTQESVVGDFLIRLIALVEADAGSIHLLDHNQRLMMVINQQMPTELLDIVKTHHQQADFCCEQTAIFHHGTQLLLCFPLCYAKQCLGILNLVLNQPKTMSLSNRRLIGSLSVQLAVTIKNLHLLAQEKQLAVLQERNLLAQGLHDSIAQSLSFLNLQTQMQIKAIDQHQWNKASQNAHFIHDGVQRCYEDIRELLSNFKTTSLPEDFIQTIHTLVARYRQQLAIPVHLNLKNQDYDINDEEKLQMVFILQEALSNIRKHAQAKEVFICFSSEKNGFQMRIQDNGLGFDHHKTNMPTANHIGLQIMQERADKAGAQLHIESTLGQGSTITVFLPKTIQENENNASTQLN